MVDSVFAGSQQPQAQMPIPQPAKREQNQEMVDVLREAGAMLQLRSHRLHDRAVVTRLVDDSLGYVQLVDGARSLSITPDLTPSYKGEEWAEIGISVGSSVDVDWDEATGIALAVTLAERPKFAGG